MIFILNIERAFKNTQNMFSIHTCYTNNLLVDQKICKCRLYPVQKIQILAAQMSDLVMLPVV